MEEKKSWGGARAGAGRPRISDNPNKMRSMRLTDEEYDLVRWVVKKYRAGEEVSLKDFKR